MKIIKQFFQKHFIDKVVMSDSIELKVKRGIPSQYIKEVQDLYNLYKENPQKTHLIAALTILCFAIETRVNEMLFAINKNGFEKIEKQTLLEKIKLLYKSKNQVFSKTTYYEDIKDLIKLRNLFVHYKPQLREINSTEEELFNKVTEKNLIKYYSKALKLLKDLEAVLDLPSETIAPIPYSNRLDLK
ncbi:MAG: hypothetical protein PHP08_04135 [Candidatus Dojkabacteria bacterium]|nr:hypothetical protein [Candidatus Dojkabacteria bacterium]